MKEPTSGDHLDWSINRCDPCSYDGTSVNADGYCETCQEYLCSACIDVHKRFKMSREHIVSINRRESVQMLNRHLEAPAIENGIDVDIPPLKPSHIIPIEKLDHNLESPLITGMAPISATRLLIVDYKNCELKIILLEDKKTQSLAIFPETPPYDVTAPDEDTVAVACGFKNFIMKYQQNDWHIISRIYYKDTYYCTGVTHSDKDELIFAVTKPLPLILKTDLTGTVLLKVRLKASNHEPYPYSIDIGPIEQRIYLSDFVGNCFLEVSSDKSIQNFGHCTAPTSIAVDGNANVFVISEGEIHFFKLKGLRAGRISIAKAQTDGGPTSLAFNKKTNQLFASFDSHTIHEYQLTNLNIN